MRTSRLAMLALTAAFATTSWPAKAATAPYPIERVSVANTGAQAKPYHDHGSYLAAISAQGRFIAFTSAAPNLVPGDTNTCEDVFVRDRVRSTTARVSLRPDGGQITCPGLIGLGGSFGSAMSADGQVVAFQANPVGAGFPSPSTCASGWCQGVFVRNRTTNQTQRVDVGSSGAPANATAGDPRTVAISADGRVVIFTSLASNLVPGDRSGSLDLFARDLVTKVTERVNRGPLVVPGFTVGTSISDSGRFVVYSAERQYPIGRIYRYDRLTRATTVLNRDRAGNEVTGQFMSPVISGDGRVLAFATDQALVPTDRNGILDVYVRDLDTGAEFLVSKSSSGMVGNNESLPTSLSDDGSIVGFGSTATNLVPNDRNGQEDQFVYERSSGAIRRLSVSDTGDEGDDGSFFSLVSRDGRWDAFSSEARNLVAHDTNYVSDVFVTTTFR